MKASKMMVPLMVLLVALTGCSSSKEEPKKEEVKEETSKKEEPVIAEKDEYSEVFEYKGYTSYTVNVPSTPYQIETGDYRIDLNDDSFIIIGGVGGDDRRYFLVDYDKSKSNSDIVPIHGSKISVALFGPEFDKYYYNTVLTPLTERALNLGKSVFTFGEYHVITSYDSPYIQGALSYYVMNGYGSVETTPNSNGLTFATFPVYIIGVATKDDKSITDPMNEVLEKIAKSYVRTDLK